MRAIRPPLRRPCTSRITVWRAAACKYGSSPTTTSPIFSRAPATAGITAPGTRASRSPPRPKRFTSTSHSRASAPMAPRSGISARSGSLPGSRGAGRLNCGRVLPRDPEARCCMKLGEEAQAMLRGAMGPARQWALTHQLRVGNYLRAEDLVRIEQAHIMADTESLGEAGVAFLERLATMPEAERGVRVPTITDPRGTDFTAAKRLGQQDWIVALERRAV